MRRSLILAAPLAVAIAVAYGAAFVANGYPVQPLPILAGAAGWLVALILRSPIGLVGLKVTRDEERIQTWVMASSGPLEESVRLAALLLVGRDLDVALWLGLGWAAIEILYSIVNGFALAALAERTDPEAERVKAMLPPSAFNATGPWWGVIERAWASTVHIGFTLILAAIPWLVVVTAPLHTLTNVAFMRLITRRSLLLVSALGVVYGAALMAVGLLLHRI